MIYDKSSQTDADLCAFVESLPSEHLYWLTVTPPLGDDILKHAAKCEACAQLIQTAGDNFYMSLSQPSRLRVASTARRARDRFDAEAKSSAFNALDRGTLELAASGEREDSNETRDRVRIATFDIQGTEFQALEGTEGNVFLQGPVPTLEKRIWFGRDAFVLKRSNASDESEIENLGSVDLEQFLALHQDDPEGFPIRFAD
jgi:hypothetical protein